MVLQCMYACRTNPDDNVQHRTSSYDPVEAVMVLSSPPTLPPRNCRGINPSNPTPDSKWLVLVDNVHHFNYFTTQLLQHNVNRND